MAMVISSKSLLPKGTFNFEYEIIISSDHTFQISGVTVKMLVFSSDISIFFVLGMWSKSDTGAEKAETRDPFLYISVKLTTENDNAWAESSMVAEKSNPCSVNKKIY